MSSLRRNLNVSLTLILVLVFIAIWLSISFAINKVAEDQMLLHLQHDGDSLVSSLRFDGEGNLVLADGAVEDVYRQLGSGHYFSVRTEDGRLLKSPSLGEIELQYESVPPGSAKSQRIESPGHEAILVLIRGLFVEERLVQVLVGEHLGNLKDEVIDQSLRVLTLILPILLVALVLQGILINRAMKPLTHIHQALRSIGRGEVKRIDLDSPDEIQPLVEEVNRLQVLLTRRLLQSRTAIGNLAHALKTPLAVLFRIADDESLSPDIRKAMQDQTTSIHNKLNRELKRARLSGGDSIASSINLSAELEVMSKILTSIYSEKALQIDISAPGTELPYDREDLLELLGNLADNACKWASKTVRIEIAEQAENTGLNILVSDDGPGCPEEMYGTLAERGLRLDESKEGHGLGLAICQEIVAFYGGKMRLARSKKIGGLEVSVFLPHRPSVA